MPPDGGFLYLVFEIFKVVITVLIFVYLFVLSIVVNDYKIIVERPFLFTVELIFMMVLPAIPVLFFAISRSIPFAKAVSLAVLFSVLTGIFHILFQLSGGYRHIVGI